LALFPEQLVEHVVPAHDGLVEALLEDGLVDAGEAVSVANVEQRLGEKLHQVWPADGLGIFPAPSTRARSRLTCAYNSDRDTLMLTSVPEDSSRLRDLARTIPAGQPRLFDQPIRVSRDHAERILRHNDFSQVANLAGGWLTYAPVKAES
jgi:hypothetical protein